MAQHNPVPNFEDLDYSSLYPSVMIAHNLVNPMLLEEPASQPTPEVFMTGIMTNLMNARVKAAASATAQDKATDLSHFGPHEPKCIRCHEKNPAYRCGRCHLRYCGPECQRKDWPDHRTVCVVGAISAHLRE